MNFRENLAAAQARSRLAIGIVPSIRKMPHALQRYDDPFLPFGQAVIDSTGDLVCAYVFDLAAYLSQGASGAVALERTIAYVPAGVLKILHGPFASSHYVDAAFGEGFQADAVTLGCVDANIIKPYLEDRQHGVFVRIPSDADFDRSILMEAHTGHQGQVGVYREISPGHKLFELFFESIPNIHWYWDEIIYASSNDDYAQAMRKAAQDRLIPADQVNPD